VEESPLPGIDSTTIDRHITELAKDEYAGRMPFTEGEVKTLAYLEGAFRELGLEPGNGDSYRQAVPMVEITGRPDTSIRLQGPGGPIDWRLTEDYVTFTDLPLEEISVEDAELVFCGFGIVAPEFDRNDYAGVDMTGKIAVVFVNDPGYYLEDSTRFSGKTMTYYGRYTYKFEEAARQGAAGAIVIHEPGAAGYPWFVVQSSWTGPRLVLAEDQAVKSPLNAWITLDAARELFQASGVAEGRWLERALAPDFTPVPLNTRLTTTVRNELRFDTSYNVVARLRGTETPDEHVIYTAHWDHIGVGPAVRGDSIYNGALDNASGTALLLSIAEAYTKLPEPPARSVVFLSVTAEEQGLWGSAHYVNDPVYPLKDCVANLNIDGINPSGRSRDLTITGYGHSQMDDLAAAAAESQGRYVQPEQEPEKGYFFRSDHFNFAKAGIPVLYAKGGYDHWERGKEYALAQRQEFVQYRYHQPADEYTSGAWPLAGAVQDGELYFRVGLNLAAGRSWPRWRPSSAFFTERLR
jgi:Zn-dependent M28 family amino/carboxypeptidase